MVSELTVVTGWSPLGWDEYARNFYRSFCEHWPRDVRLIAYGEDFPKDPIPRCEFRRLSSIPGCMEFLDRHLDSRLAHGCEPTPRWKDRERQAGYSFRFDAWKFCRQGFIPYDAALSCESEYLCWLDADIVTFKRIQGAKSITRLLPEDKDVAYLGRHPKHSEIGFQLYRVHRDGKTVPRTFQMLKLFSDIYSTDAVFDLQEWHSAYVFDHCRSVWMDVKGGYACNLTPGGNGHVWFQSPLKQWMDHLKGDRKARGRSKERV